MIEFHFETDFELKNEAKIRHWISDVIVSEDCSEGEINYIFCNDSYLHKINVAFLNHDTLTDIISFDNSVGKQLNGDIFISIERVADNAKDFKVSFDDELKRVIIHGILHYCGYKDKTDEEATLMRQKEDEKIKMFHVEH